MDQRNLICYFQQLIENETYDIDTILEKVPEYLLDDLKESLKNSIKEENIEESITR